MSAPYLYFLIVDALGYLLEASHIARKMHVILLLGGSNMVNKQFFVDSLLLIRA
jgi:hypothetical protein